MKRKTELSAQELKPTVAEVPAIVDEAALRQAFTLRSLYRAIQFCQGCADKEIVSTLSTQLGWSHFIELLPIKDPLARDFCAEICRIERWDVRTLRLKIGGMLFQRTDDGLFKPAVANPPKLSTGLREMQPQAEQRFHEVGELRPAATHKECLSVRPKGAREVLPYTPDAWVGSDATRINCEVSFTRHVWHFKPKLDALLEGAPA